MIVSILEILVNVKSTPDSIESVEQLIASLPVTVNEIDDELELPYARARVTVGGVRSAATVVVVVVVVDVVAATVVVVGVATATHLSFFATFEHTSF